jgi:hypothetical protein
VSYVRAWTDEYINEPPSGTNIKVAAVTAEGLYRHLKKSVSHSCLTGSCSNNNRCDCRRKMITNAGSCMFSLSSIPRRLVNCLP